MDKKLPKTNYFNIHRRYKKETQPPGNIYSNVRSGPKIHENKINWMNNKERMRIWNLKFKMIAMGAKQSQKWHQQVLLRKPKTKEIVKEGIKQKV